MSDWIIFVPAIVSLLVLLIYRSPEKAFLNVYLPVLLAVPAFSLSKVPGLPPINFAISALTPIGVWFFVVHFKQWRFTRMDLWVLLFGVSCCSAFFLRESSPTFGIFAAFYFVVNAFFPYMIGRQMVEQKGFRLAFIKRVVILLSIIGFASLYEFRMGTNPFHHFSAMLFPNDKFAEVEQFRWGFCRTDGPYFQSETTGMVFIFGSMLAFWLARNNAWSPKLGNLPLPLKKGTILLIGVLIGMVTNQARGPYLGFIFAYLLARAGFSKNISKAVRRNAVLLLIVAGVVYTSLRTYTSDTASVTSVDQGDAVYRVKLLQNYVEVAIDGGWLGWGNRFPIIDGQKSIDNAYLLFGLQQGYLGFLTFSILVIEAMVAFIQAMNAAKQRIDKNLALSLLSCLLGIAICLGTVFLTTPVYELSFILFGWSQALKRSEATAPELVADVPEVARFRYRRVFS